MALPRADLRDTVGVVADVVLPLFARGIIVRRQRVVGALDRLDADRRAVRRLQRLRRRHGPGPVLLRGVPGREVAFVLDADTARRVLDGSPVPFSPASWEKRRALAHFEPEAVLIAPVERRPELRRVNEDVLDTARPVHRLHEQIAAKVDAEAAGMLGGTLSWDRFAVHWWRLVRRIVLGDAARDDDEITDLLARLRGMRTGRSSSPGARGCAAASRPGCRRTSTGASRAASPRWAPRPPRRRNGCSRSTPRACPPFARCGC